MRISYIFLLLFCIQWVSFVDAENALPEIPKGQMSVSEASRLREELEFLKKDVEEKIFRLETAKQAYDTSKAAVDFQLKKLDEDRRLLDESLQKEKTLKADRLNASVDLVAKMDPRKAAALMESMDRDLVLALMTKLPQRQMTKILEAVSANKATQYLEYYTHIRSGREFEMLKDLGLCAPSKENNEEKLSISPNTSNNPA